MSMKVMTPVVLLALLCGSSLAGKAQISPTEKVIELLNGMLEKGKDDKKQEQVQFNSYKQFCDDTSTEKTRAIAEAEELIMTLKADIEKYNADTERLTKEIAGHEKDVAAWTGDKEAATKVRQMEKATYDKTHKDYSESIDALGRAIDTLKKQLAKSKEETDTGSFIQVSSLTELSLIPPQAKKAINVFLQQGSQGSLGEEAAPEATGYGFQSNGIIDMLKKLESKFVDEKTELEKSEAAAVQAFKLLMSDLKAQLDAANSDIKEKTTFKASCVEKKADAEGQIADTTSTKESDQKYLSDLTATCQQKSTDFDTRQQLRADEIEAVEKAIEIMSADNVSGAAEKHASALIQGPHLLEVQGDHFASSFAQLRTEAHTSSQARMVSYLKRQAEELHSRVLSVAAQRAESDPFGKVKKMIAELIDKLMAEASDEADAKGACDKDLASNEHTRKAKTESVETTHAEIDELNSYIAKLTGEIADLQQGVADLDTAMAKATDVRLTEKEKNKQTIAEAKEAQAATAKAVGVLKDFYEKAAESTALVQQKSSEPEIFDAPYKGMQSGNGGVVGMLEVIESDFARLEADTTAAEASAETEYKAFSADSKADKKSKMQDIEHSNTKKQDKNQALILAKEDLEGTQEELGAALNVYEKLKVACLDSGVDYEDRVARRKQELESLQNALDILEGNAI